MRKFIMLLAVVSILGFTADSEAAAGLKAGVSMSELTGDAVTSDLDMRQGLFVGLRFPSDNFEIELMYAEKGLADNDSDSTVALDYAQASLLLYLGEGGAFIGGYTASLITAETRIAGTNTDISDTLNDTDTGIILGYRMGQQNTNIEFRYSMSIETIDPDPDTEVLNSSASVSLSFMF